MTLFAVLRGQIAPADAVAADIVKTDGRLTELQRMIELFTLQQPEPAAPNASAAAAAAGPRSGSGGAAR